MMERPYLCIMSREGEELHEKGRKKTFKKSQQKISQVYGKIPTQVQEALRVIRRQDHKKVYYS